MKIVISEKEIKDILDALSIPSKYFTIENEKLLKEKQKYEKDLVAQNKEINELHAIIRDDMYRIQEFSLKKNTEIEKLKSDIRAKESWIAKLIDDKKSLETKINELEETNGMLTHDDAQQKGDRIIMAKSAKELKSMTLKEFEKAAEQFDNDDPSIYNLCRKDYPDILAELEKEEFMDVLDAGCGTGAVIALLAKKYPKKHYTGIDLSPKMIEVASAKKTENAVFVCGDCENLPFEDNSFDAITCSMSFHHYPHPVDFFRSCERVLRPGGRLIIRDMTAGSIMLKLINAVEMPLAHLLGKGDVACYGRKDFERFCQESGLKLELFEQRKGFRLHSVMRKSV